jgi:proliferating cell nuclear antigen
LTFGARTSGSDDLKAIISAISTLVEEATFVATAEGITFRGMDPSHVALIDISWPNSAFEKYECDSDIKFGVRIDEFSKLIKRADKKDSIEIGISEQNMLLVTVKILGDVQVVSDYLTIHTSDSKADFSGKGDSGEVVIDLEKDTDESTITSTEDSTGTYSLEYLNPVVKAVGTTAGLITCEFSSAKPLRIEFKVANIGRIHFYLAPRVES